MYVSILFEIKHILKYYSGNSRLEFNGGAEGKAASKSCLLGGAGAKLPPKTKAQATVILCLKHFLILK